MFDDKYLAEFIYGSIDGLITTFAIVSGSIGGNLPYNVILILGLSNVVADGYSMGISRYSSYETEKSTLDKDKLTSSIITFASFVIIGLIPIIPFIFLKKDAEYVSFSLTMLMFFVIGCIKGHLVNKEHKKNDMSGKSNYIQNKKKTISVCLETLFIGLSASIISYSIGRFLSKYN